MNETLELLRDLDRKLTEAERYADREPRTESADLIEVSRFVNRLSTARARRDESTLRRRAK